MRIIDLRNGFDSSEIEKLVIAAETQTSVEPIGHGDSRRRPRARRRSSLRLLGTLRRFQADTGHDTSARLKRSDSMLRRLLRE